MVDLKDIKTQIVAGLTEVEANPDKAFKDLKALNEMIGGLPSSTLKDSLHKECKEGVSIIQNMDASRYGHVASEYMKAYRGLIKSSYQSLLKLLPN